MATCVHASCGPLGMPLWPGLWTAPSWHTLTSWACGWSVATDRHPSTPSVWRTGAATGKHVARGAVFLGCPLSHRRGPRWGAVIRLAVQGVPAGEVRGVLVADTTTPTAHTVARPQPQWPGWPCPVAPAHASPTTPRAVAFPTPVGP